MISPLLFQYPIFDRRFDFNKEELTSLELTGRLAQKLNEVIEILNNWDDNVALKEDSSNLTKTRKLSPTGNFTGLLSGRNVLDVLSLTDTNKDKISYLTNQFADGQTGLVIDGGFFEGSLISKNYDGGVY